MRVIIDWKTCANIQELKWNTSLKAYETFIDTYGYMMRAAVYSEIEAMRRLELRSRIS